MTEQELLDKIPEARRKHQPGPKNESFDEEMAELIIDAAIEFFGSD